MPTRRCHRCVIARTHRASTFGILTPPVEAPVTVLRPLRPPAAGLVLAQSLLLTLLPDGGQHGSRRNAWAGMVADASLARARRDVDAALGLALDRAAAISDRRIATR